MDATPSKDASRYVALDRLCISPQDGFSSNYPGNPVVEVAGSVSGGVA
jgi:hypothetical protein